jgi:hypothetical protein
VAKGPATPPKAAAAAPAKPPEKPLPQNRPHVSATYSSEISVVFVQPGLAEEPLEPRRGCAVLTVIACTLAAYIVLAVLYKTVKEHVV